MKFLKVLVNSLLSGILFSALLAVLIWDLNINMGFDLPGMGLLALHLAQFYGLAVAFACFLAFFIIQFFAGRKLKIAVVSPSFLALSFSLLTLLYLGIFRANYRYFGSFFDPQTRSRISIQAGILLATAVVGFTLFYAARRSRKKAYAFAVYFILWTLGLGTAVAQRGKFSSPPQPARAGGIESKKIDKKITIIGFEGLSYEILLPLVSQAKLPNFSWLIDRSAWGRLESFTPNEPFILNHSLDTGKLPHKHRQISLFSYRLMKGGPEIEVAPRFIFFRQLARLGLLEISQRESASGARDIWSIIEANAAKTVHSGSLPTPCEPGSNPKADKAFAQSFAMDGRGASGPMKRVEKSFICDWETEERAFQERSLVRPEVFHLLLDGLNSVEAYFYKYSFPESYGSIDQEDINRYGSVIEKYLAFYDQMVGKYLASRGEDELLVVYSAFGVEPLPVWKRFVDWILGNPGFSGHHEGAPDGLIFFKGAGVRNGSMINGIKLVDIAPTLLYYLGLPVGKDMDGIVQSRIFLPEYTAENPILSIHTYEGIEIKNRKP